MVQETALDRQLAQKLVASATKLDLRLVSPLGLELAMWSGGLELLSGGWIR